MGDKFVEFLQVYFSKPDSPGKIYDGSLWCEKHMGEAFRKGNPYLKKMEELLCDYGFSNEAPIFDAADHAIMFAAGMLADKYGVDRDAMSWHIWENEFGKKKMGCCLNGQKKTHKIKNASDFWDFERIR